MQNENFVYYKECTNCRKTFFARYFLQHNCSFSDNQEFTDEETTNNDGSIISISKKNEFVSNHSNQQFDNSYINLNNVVVDDNTLTDNVNGEEMNDNDFDEFLQEAYLLDEDDDLLINNSEMVILVKWISLIMTHWQRLFNITDNSLCLLLKFCMSFSKLCLKMWKSKSWQILIMASSS